MSNKKENKRKIKIINIIIAAVLFLGVAVLAIIPPLVISDMISMHVDFKTFAAEEFGIKSKQLSLTTVDGLNLAAWFVPSENPAGTVLFVSGIHQPSVTAYFPHVKMLAENGYSSLLIEMRAHGKSEGNLICLGMKEHLDVRAGLEFVRKDSVHKDLPVIVYGFSMGGATAINSMGQLPDLDGLISISAFSSWADVFTDTMQNMGLPKFVCAAQKPFVKLYSAFKIGVKASRINPIREIKKLNGRPALFMHSTEDSQVGFINFERLLKKAPQKVDVFTREGDCHFIVDDHFEEPWLDKEYANAIISFLDTNFK